MPQKKRPLPKGEELGKSWEADFWPVTDRLERIRLKGSCLVRLCLSISDLIHSAKRLYPAKSVFWFLACHTSQNWCLPHIQVSLLLVLMCSSCWHHYYSVHLLVASSPAFSESGANLARFLTVQEREREMSSWLHTNIYICNFSFFYLQLSF